MATNKDILENQPRTGAMSPLYGKARERVTKNNMKHQYMTLQSPVAQNTLTLKGIEGWSLIEESGGFSYFKRSVDAE